MRDAIEVWAKYQTEGQHLASGSIALYRAQLIQYLDLLPPPDVVRAADIRALLKHARARGLSPSAINVLLAALKHFYRWATDNAAAGAFRTMSQHDKRKQKLPRALTIDHCYGLLVECAKRGDWLGKRDEALFTLLWATGLRVSEALSLKINFAAERRDAIRVIGKGSKERVVPILDCVWDVVDEYLVALPHSGLDDDAPLFVTENGTALGDRDVRRIFAAYAARLGLPEDASPHSLRHSFATHLLNSGANLIDLKELLGHESVSTTAIYAHIAMDRLLEQYDAAHPRAA